MDENVKYINTIGTSSLEKYTISLETDIIRIVKDTMAMSVVSEEEFRSIKANQE